MATTPLIALITAGASLLVAIISVISALISSRNSTKLAKDLERLKHTLALEKDVIDEKKRINNELLTAFNDSVKAIQKVKDVIQQIVFSYEKSHHSEVAVRNISTVVKELTSSYEERFTDFVKSQHPHEKLLFHKAKGLALNVEAFVTSVLDGKTYTSDLSTEEKDRLIAWRLEISELQTQLQNSLYEQFIKCSVNAIGARNESKR